MIATPRVSPCSSNHRISPDHSVHDSEWLTPPLPSHPIPSHPIPSHPIQSRPSGAMLCGRTHVSAIYNIIVHVLLCNKSCSALEFLVTTHIIFHSTESIVSAAMMQKLEHRDLEYSYAAEQALPASVVGGGGDG